jgi:hypothetical protein
VDLNKRSQYQHERALTEFPCASSAVIKPLKIDPFDLGCKAKHLDGFTERTRMKAPRPALQTLL